MGNIIAFARDSLTNLVSRLGTERDKAAHTTYSMPMLADEEAVHAYRGAWLPRKIVDIPAFDSCRNWRNWQASNQQVEQIEAEEKRLNLRGKVLEARIKARLFGGAAIMIGTGEEDLAKPLDVERIGKGGLKYLTVFTRRELNAGEIDRDPASEWYGKPKSFSVTGGNGLQLEVHPSRLAIFQGNQVADDEQSAALHQGWGDSVLVSVIDAVKNADSTAANIASLIFEAKVDIIRVPDFMASLGNEEYKRKILERYTLAATSKGINGTLMLDKEEEYESKSANFSTLPDILMSFMQITAGAADIPVTRLLGQSPAGLNSTGEADLRNYYDRISAMQEIEMTPAMYRLDEALIRSATGGRDPNIHYIWASLWQISDKERADIGKIDAESAKILVETGLIPPEPLAKAVVAQLVEHSIYPGLEAAVEEFGGLMEPDDGIDQQAAMTPTQKPTTDAAPRSLYVRRDVLNAEEIIAWAKAQGFETTLPANDLHVTITFSREAVDWMKMGQAWSGDDGKLTIAPGGVRLMERFGDATVLLFVSSELAWRHEEMIRAGASWDHPEYQPHITISYAAGNLDLSKAEPYRGKIVLGPEIFEEVKTDWKSGISED